jgi:hypothetical protein
MIAESKKRRQEKRGNITKREVMAPRPIPRRPSRQSLRRLSTALGLDNPTSISKNNPSVLFCIFAFCFRLLCSSELVRAEQISAFCQSFPIPFGVWKCATRGNRCFRHNSDWNSETSSGGREKGRKSNTNNKNRHHRLARPFHTFAAVHRFSSDCFLCQTTLSDFLREGDGWRFNESKDGPAWVAFASAYLAGGHSFVMT